MHEHPEVTLFKSPLVRIIEHRCRGENTHGSSEEVAGGNQICFPRFGVYKKRNRLGEYLVDPNHISFFQKDQPYQVHHPIKSLHTHNSICDISTIFEIPDNVMEQMLLMSGRYPDNVSAFLNSAVRVSPSLKAYQYFILNRLTHLQDEEQIGFEEAVLDFLFGVLAASCDVRSAFFQCCKSTQVQSDHAELVEQVKIVIGRNSCNRLSLEDISHQVHHTPFSLSRIFKNHTGTTIHTYLLRTRLLHSLEQIMNSPIEQVGQIGVDFGFSTPSHFSTVFTREFNMSPSAFRRQANSKQMVESSNFLKA